MPPPVQFVEGWQIGKPDLVLELPKRSKCPASGVIDYQHVIVPTGFTKDTWVQAAEVRPTDRAVVHHIIAFVREPKSNWFKEQKAGEFFIAPQVKTKEEPDTSALPSDFLVGYAPGQPAEILRPGQAKLIKAGSDIVFQVHYTPNGKPVSDRTKLGLLLAKRAAARARANAFGHEWNIQDSAGRSELSCRCDVRSEDAGEALRRCIRTCTAVERIFDYRVVYPNGESRDPSQRSALQLALAELVQPGGAVRAAERDKDRMHGAF